MRRPHHFFASSEAAPSAAPLPPHDGLVAPSRAAAPPQPHNSLVAPSRVAASPPPLAADVPPPERKVRAPRAEAAATTAKADESSDDFSAAEGVVRDASRLAAWSRSETDALATRHGSLSVREVWQLLEKVNEETSLHAQEARKVLSPALAAPAAPPQSPLLQ